MRYLVLLTFLIGYFNSFSQLIVSTSPWNTSCFGLCDGGASSNSTGGAPPYNYTWNTIPVQNTQFVSGLCAGIYIVTVTDALSAQVSDTIVINEPQMLTSFINSTDATCNGVCDGFASAIGSGGTQPYTYLWDDPTLQFGPTAVNLCSGLYNVTITDSNGCMAINSVTILESSPLTGAVNVVDDSCGVCIGSANVVPDGGGVFTYNWSPIGATTSMVNNLCAGNYLCTVTDTNGCYKDFNAIVNTAPGCPIGTVSGTVYYDSNTNCTQDTLENGLQNVMLQATPGPYYSSTNANGDYSFSLPFGNYTITQVVPQYYGELCPALGSYAVVLDSINNNLMEIDFADTLPPIQDVRILLNSGTPRPGFSFNYYLTYSNLGNIPANGVVYLVFDDTLNFDSASIAPDLVSGDTLFWNYSNLQTGENRIISATYTVPAEVGLLGENLQACANISPIAGDFDPSNNSTCYNRIIVGSYDPNDKQVEPKGVGPTGDILLTDTELKYTIRFQNSGTFMATNVVVEDMLSVNLEVTSLRDVSASHPFTYDVSGQGVLIFTFNGINLPDSNVNEPASHGLIEFTIDQHASNGIGTVIENTADIYFDFNPAIVTNTVTNTIVTVTAINENEFSLNDVNVYPNPSNGKFAITYKLEKSSNVSVRIVDMVGKIIKDIPVTNMSKGKYKTEINISNMNSGIYFMSIKIGEETHIKKVVVQ